MDTAEDETVDIAKADTRAIFAMFAAPLPPVAKIIDGMEKYATRILDANPTDDVKADANEAIVYCGALRQAIADGNVQTTAFEGIRLGQTYERMMVRPFEPDVSLGRGQKRRGREQVAQIAEGRRERAQKILAYLNERRKRRGRHKTPYDTAIYSDAAAKFNVSIPTVRRADGKKKVHSDLSGN